MFECYGYTLTSNITFYLWDAKNVHYFSAKIRKTMRHRRNPVGFTYSNTDYGIVSIMIKYPRCNTLLLYVQNSAANQHRMYLETEQYVHMCHQ